MKKWHFRGGITLDSIPLDIFKLVQDPVCTPVLTKLTLIALHGNDNKNVAKQKWEE